ncbi:Pentatricopeptide repeat [Trema orientale]|uniref:Pentatricopeptide repeat n=1 Tax=Trema orientale TaxID=63057 RepID=A0A2P5EVE6_TREOI|nr:Pentatricopeptide repeat [Trema orientale]
MPQERELRSHGQGLPRGRAEGPPPPPRPQNSKTIPPNPRPVPPPWSPPIQPSRRSLRINLRVSQQDGLRESGLPTYLKPEYDPLQLHDQGLLSVRRAIRPDEYTFAPLLNAFSNLCEFRMDAREGFEPDKATVLTVLPVCARLGAADVGQWIHSYTETKGLLQEVVSVGNALVDFYCKSGSLELAPSIFKHMPQKDVFSWIVMIFMSGF